MMCVWVWGRERERESERERERESERESARERERERASARESKRGPSRILHVLCVCSVCVCVCVCVCVSVSLRCLTHSYHTKKQHTNKCCVCVSACACVCVSPTATPRHNTPNTAQGAAYDAPNRPNRCANNGRTNRREARSYSTEKAAGWSCRGCRGSWDRSRVMMCVCVCVCVRACAYHVIHGTHNV